MFQHIDLNIINPYQFTLRSYSFTTPAIFWDCEPCHFTYFDGRWIDYCCSTILDGSTSLFFMYETINYCGYKKLLLLKEVVKSNLVLDLFPLLINFFI